MRIVFMGATELGFKCCRTLFEIGQDVVGIFSIPKEFKISWAAAPVTNVLFKGFEELAEAHGVPLFYVTKRVTDTEYEENLRRLQPDILIVVGWYYMVPRSWRAVASHGAVGLHASLLPKYRGGAPLVWAIINEETRAGVSLFYLTDGVDEGDLIAQADFEIGWEEDIADVVRKAAVTSQRLVREYVPLLDRGQVPRWPQDHSQATLMPQRNPEDGLIYWRSMSARQVYNWVRAQTRPYPGAFTYLGQEKVTIWKSSLSRPGSTGVGVPGGIAPEVPGAQQAFGVWCADGELLLVREVGLSNGTVASGSEFIAAGKISRGTAFFETSNQRLGVVERE